MLYGAVKAARMPEAFKGNFPPVENGRPLCSCDKEEAPDWELEDRKVN